MRRQYKIFSTKILDKSVHKLLLLHGFDVEEVDAIAIEYEEELAIVEKALNGEFGAIIFTSSRGVDAISGLLQKHIARMQTTLICCIGYRTKEVIEELGLQVTVSADNASILAEKVSQLSVSSVLYICGNLASQDMQNGLAKFDIVVDRLEVYNTILNYPKLEMTDYEALLFFSPSGVRSIFQNNNIPKDALAVAIGSTTGRALQELEHQNIFISPRPDIEILLSSLKSHLEENHAVQE